MEPATKIRTRLVELANHLVEEVARATADYAIEVHSDAELEGLPPEAVARAQVLAASRGKPGYAISLERPSYERAMANLHARGLRKTLYEAYFTRASDHGPQARRHDAAPIVEEILELRASLANEAGFPNYAAYALRDGLISSPDEAEQYLLATRRDTRSRAETELNRLWEFAKEKGVPRGFSHWDLAFYSTWLQKEAFGYDGSTSTRLSLSRVTAVLATWCERLLGVQLAPTEEIDTTTAASRLTFTLHPVGAAAVASCLGKKELTLQWFSPEPHVRRITADSTGNGTRLVLGCGLEVPSQGSAVWLTAPEAAKLFGQVATGVCELVSLSHESQDPALAPPPLGARLAGLYFERLGLERAVLSECGASYTDAEWRSASQAFALNGYLYRSMELEMQLFDLRIHRDYIPRARASQFRGQIEDTFIHVRRKFSVLPAPYWTRVANTQTQIFAAGWGAHLWEQVWLEEAAVSLFHRMDGAGCKPDACTLLAPTFFSPHATSLTTALQGLVPLPGMTPAAAE